MRSRCIISSAILNGVSKAPVVKLTLTGIKIEAIGKSKPEWPEKDRPKHR